jgi:hypothetical protein
MAPKPRGLATRKRALNRAILEVSDREIMLGEIKAMFGNDERFRAWYNIVYQYRSRGEHETYEKLIADKHAEMRQAERIAALPSPLLQRRAAILAALTGEPLTAEAASELIDELAEIETKAWDLPPMAESVRGNDQITRNWDDIPEERF